MSERAERLRREALLQMVRDEANAREEQFRKDQYENFLFHDDLADAYTTYGNGHELDELKQDFLRDKKDKDMLGRFELALSDKYLGAIHVVELGSTIKPGQNGELDGLKGEYIKLKQWMVEMDLIETEMTREDSGRFFDVTYPEVTRERVVIGRTRPLISETIEVTDKDQVFSRQVHIGIAKRMVFSIPSGLYQAYERNDPRLELDSTKRSLEELLESAKGNNLVDPIRTTYYLRTSVTGGYPINEAH